MALIIKNGVIYNAADSFKADVRSHNGIITQIADKIVPESNDDIINAAGLEIYPGAIDVHTHLDMPCADTVTADDFESGSIAAACGGTTCLIDYANPIKGRPLKEAIELWHKKAAGRCAVDYGFHLTITENNEQIETELPEIINEGITSLKCFFAYKNSLMLNDGEFLATLELARKYGALILLHAENGEIISRLASRFIAEGKTGPQYHRAAHPIEAESEAVHRGAVMAALCETPLYIVHTSSRKALDEIKTASARSQMIFGETCPQYLLLTDELYHKNGFEAAKWVMSPPLRSKDDNEALWNALRDGNIKVIATDHCSFNFKGQKDKGISDFTKIPNGAPGIGDRVNLIYSYGVNGGRISKNRFAEVMSYNPAKIFGLYPQKGTISIGSDADFTIINPDKKSEISSKTSHYKADYNAYEGFALKGTAVMSVSRGRLIAKDGGFLGTLDHGRFIKRKKFDSKLWPF